MQEAGESENGWVDTQMGGRVGRRVGEYVG